MPSGRHKSKTTLEGCFYNLDQPKFLREDNALGRKAYNKKLHKEMIHHKQQAADISMRKISTSRFWDNGTFWKRLLNHIKMFKEV